MMPQIFSEQQMLRVEYKSKETGNVFAYIYGVPHIGLVTLHVDEQYRRQGYGMKLMQEYIRLVKEKTNETFVRFECHKDNSPALALYRKLGFSFREETDDDCATIICLLKVGI